MPGFIRQKFKRSYRARFSAAGFGHSAKYTGTRALSVCVAAADGRWCDRLRRMKPGVGGGSVELDRVARLESGQIAGRIARFEPQIEASRHMPLDSPRVLARIGEARGDGRP